MVPKRIYSYYNITWIVRYRNNTNICVRMELIRFVGISLLITEMTWILLNQVESRSSFGYEFTFMSSFGTMEICSYVSWTNDLIPIIEYLLLTFWPRNGYKLVHSLTLLGDISLSFTRWIYPFTSVFPFGGDDAFAVLFI